MKKIEWMSDGGISYKIEIGDGSQTVTSLTPGVTPFVLNTDQDDDLFCPIRTQSGNIQIVEESVDIDDVIGDNPFARPVSLYSGTTLIWTGYLQGQAFTQTWDKGPNTISIPVTSQMNVLRCLYPSNDKDDLVYISFADFLCQLKVDDTPLYWRYYFPAGLFAADSFTDDASGKNPLRMKFNLLNYATWNEDTKQYDVQSYYDILEDIARLFGFQIIEKGTRLCFLWADKQTNYISIGYDQLNLLSSNPSQTVTNITQTTVTHDIWSNDHSMTFISGKRKVKAINKINLLDKAIYEMNVNGETKGTTNNASRTVGGDGTQYFLSQNYVTDNNSVMRPMNSNVNLKYEDWHAGTNTHKGCCIVRDRTFIRHSGAGTLTYYSDDTGWCDRIIFRFVDNPAQDTKLITIVPPTHYFYNKLTMPCYLTLQAKVKFAADQYDDWHDYDGVLPISVQNGASQGGGNYVRVKDGKLTGGYSASNPSDPNDGFTFQMLNADGNLVISIPALTSEQLFVYSINPDYFYSIEDLKLIYETPSDSVFSYENPIVDYKKQYETNIGFENDYEEESGLCCQHGEVHQASFFGSTLLSTGVILANNLISGTPPTVLYGTNPPEEELAARLYAYYQQTRKKLEVVMRCTGDLYDPWMLHKPATNNLTLPGMSLLAQQIDFARDEIRCDLFDIS